MAVPKIPTSWQLLLKRAVWMALSAAISILAHTVLDALASKQVDAGVLTVVIYPALRFIADYFDKRIPNK